MKNETGPFCCGDDLSREGLSKEDQYLLEKPCRIATVRRPNGEYLTTCQGVEYGQPEALDLSAKLLAAQIMELSKITGETPRGVLQLVQDEL